MKNKLMGRKKIHLVFTTISVLFVCTCVLFSALVFLNASMHSDDDRFITIDRGNSSRMIADALYQAKIIRSADFMYFYSRLIGSVPKAGTYRISFPMTTIEIINYLDEGKTETTRVTIPEGLSIRKTARFLEKAGVVDQHQFISAATDTLFIQSLGISGISAEGFLFPDTYFFPYQTDGESVVKIMVANFFKKVATIENFPSDSASLYEKIILSSIIEREYRLVDEAPLISSVFTNRLRIGMGLQSCATVEYIITEIEQKPHPQRLTTKDLKIPSDYNTYIWAGLPPTPIANPGLIAIKAAFNPSPSKYLYFRLVDPLTGKHSFTRSLDEHVQVGRDLFLKKAADQ